MRVFSPIDNVFGGGMMRMKFELPHGFNSCPRIPGLSCFAVWPAFVDSGDRGVKYTRAALARPGTHVYMAGRRVSSSYFTGNLVGTLLTGYVIKRIGFNRSYYLPPSFLPLAVPALA